MACSLQSINNEPCHRAIAHGACPGTAEGRCVNEEGIRLLTLKNEKRAVAAWSLACAKKREEKSLFPSHFIDQGDREKPRSIEATLNHLSRLMKRARRLSAVSLAA